MISIIFIFPKSNPHKIGFPFVKYKWNVSNRIKKLLDAGQSALSRTNIKGSPRMKASNAPITIMITVWGIETHRMIKRQ